MKPTEIYEMPSLSSSVWYQDFSEVLKDVFEFEFDLGGAAHDETDTKSLLVHTKLGFTSDGSRTVTVYALTFEDEPFAVMFTGGRGGRDKREFFITDKNIWTAARGYVLSVINSATSKNVQETDVNTELFTKFYGASFVKTDSGYRAIHNQHAHPVTESLIYDQKKASAAWNAVKSGLNGAWNGKNGEMDETKLATLKAYQAGVVGKAVLLDVKLSEEQHLFAASVVDDVAFAHVFQPNSKYIGWGLDAKPHPVGPASMLECYAEVAAGRHLDEDLSYVRDIAKTFGVSPERVVEMTYAFISIGGKSVVEQIVEAAPRDERVPVEMQEDYNSIAIAYRVMDNPDITRLYPSATATWAKRMVEKAEELAAVLRIVNPGI